MSIYRKMESTSTMLVMIRYLNCVLLLVQSSLKEMKLLLVTIEITLSLTSQNPWTVNLTTTLAEAEVLRHCSVQQMFIYISVKGAWPAALKRSFWQHAL